MENIQEIYKEWRWIKYNELDKASLSFIVDSNDPFFKNKEYKNNIHYKKYTDSIVENYRHKNFEVKNELIDSYNKRIKAEAIKDFSNLTLNSFAHSPFIKSDFIENCFILVNEYQRFDLIKKIKENIVYYHWWDELSFSDLIHFIINRYFLNSTRKLITPNILHPYIQKRFANRDEFVSYLLSNFNPREKMLEEMNAVFRGTVMFNYNWLFENDLTKSIRIFENECRSENNEKIIGTYFNEDLLFREIFKQFGRKYKIISQGSPDWLGQQRFDIYLPELNIAIEYQGEQHQNPVDFGGKGKAFAKKQFKENQRRDLEKKEKAISKNCQLVYVYPEYNMKDILSELKKTIQSQEYRLKKD